MRGWLLSVFVICLLGSRCWGQVEPDGNRLTVTTANAIAVFEGGDLVRVTNRLTGEVYGGPARSIPPILQMDTLAGGDSALRCTSWRRGREQEDGRVIAAQTTFTDLTRTVWMNVVIDEQTQDITVTVWGETRKEGVTGLRWGMRGLDLTSGRLILPAQGGVWADRTNLPAALHLEYPTEWEAQMLLWQTRTGGMVIYSRDDEDRFKKLHILRRGDYADVALETEAEAPWPKAGSIPQLEWRINTYRGDWRVPASGYRQMMHFLRKQPAGASQPEWPAKIRTVVTVQSSHPDVTLLDALAARLIPSKALLYLPVWRRAGYDVDYPDYTPAPEVVPFIAHAHALGFRVMLHTDLPGVSPGNPAFARVGRYQVRDARTQAPIGWYWDHPDTDPQRFAFINPAAKVYRDLFVESVRPAVEELKPDALHLDVSGPMWNDGNGLIEGKNYAQGSEAMHRALLSAFPGIVLGGESLNEITAPYNRFAQRWITSPLPPHPICALLFGDRVASYGYLGEPNPDSSPEGFLRYFKRYEEQGVLPTLVVSSASDLASDRVQMQRLLRTARAFQDHNLAPDWSGDWSRVLFRYTGSDGSHAVLESAGAGVIFRLNGQVLYQRVRGTTQVTTPAFIAGWPAYDASTLYGLDPLREYWLDPIPRPKGTIHIVSLATGTVVARAQVTGRFALFRLVPHRKIVADLIRLLPEARPGVTWDGTDHPLGSGATAEVVEMPSGSDVEPAILEHPPWQAHVDGQTFIEYSLSLPSGSRYALQFTYGLADTARKSDGVHFRITANGRELWSADTAERRRIPAEVDLSAYAGHELQLRLITDAGPKHDPSFDHALWGEPRIVAAKDEVQGGVKIELPPNLHLAGAAGASFDAEQEGSTLEAHSVALPADLVLFLDAGTPILKNQDLLSLPFDTAVASAGLASPGTVWGSGSIGAVSCGGVRRDRTLNGHPPDHGETVFSWVLKLPQEPARLEFTAGLADGAHSSGVALEVRINGKAEWRWATHRPGWQSGSVDLAPFAGKTVLVQLVSDAVGDNLFDWARWADVAVRIGR
ncbi:MAG: NPCBM/NEW2 domain-containing protein [Chthonomonadales bacterium]